MASMNCKHLGGRATVASSKTASSTSNIWIHGHGKKALLLETPDSGQPSSSNSSVSCWLL